MTRSDIEDFIADQVQRRSAASAAVRFRSLQQLFKYLVADEWCDDNPMRGMSAPAVPEKPIPLLTDDQLRALLSTCRERTYHNRRDEAIIRVFYDTGVRVDEMTKIEVSDVDFDLDVIIVHGKGRRDRTVPFGAKTGQALDKYLRLRDREPGARGTERLWIGSRGPVTASGIYQMLERRAERVGIEGMHPHRLRHTSAHKFLEAGGQEGDAMHLFGWKSRDMLQRYGRAGQAERARAAHRRLGLGDQL